MQFLFRRLWKINEGTKYHEGLQSEANIMLSCHAKFTAGTHWSICFQLAEMFFFNIIIKKILKKKSKINSSKLLTENFIRGLWEEHMRKTTTDYKRAQS